MDEKKRRSSKITLENLNWTSNVFTDWSVKLGDLWKWHKAVRMKKSGLTHDYTHQTSILEHQCKLCYSNYICSWGICFTADGGPAIFPLITGGYGGVKPSLNPLFIAMLDPKIVHILLQCPIRKGCLWTKSCEYYSTVWLTSQVSTDFDAYGSNIRRV